MIPNLATDSLTTSRDTGDGQVSPRSPRPTNDHCSQQPHLSQPDKAESSAAEKSEDLCGSAFEPSIHSHVVPALGTERVPMMQVRLKPGSPMEAWLERDKRGLTGFNLLETLHAIARDKKSPISASINEFEFGSADAKMRFLEALAVLEPEEFAEHFSTFGVIRTEDKFRLALACGPATLNFIEQFALSDDELPTFLLKLAEDVHCAAFIAAGFKKFRINDDQASRLIALKCSEIFPFGTGNHIDQFDISDSDFHVQIARRYFQCRDSAETKQLHNFQIDRSSEGFRAVVLAAAQCIRSEGDAIDLANFVTGISPGSGQGQQITSKNIDVLLEASLYCPGEFAEAFDKYLRKKGERLRSCKDLSPAAAFFLGTVMPRWQSLEILEKAREAKTAELTGGLDAADTKAIEKLWRDKHPHLAGMISNDVMHHFAMRVERESEAILDKALERYFANRLRSSMTDRPLPHQPSAPASSARGEEIAKPSAVSVATALGLGDKMGEENPPSATFLRWVRSLWFLLELKNKTDPAHLDKLLPTIQELANQNDEGFRTRMTFLLPELDDVDLNRLSLNKKNKHPSPIIALLPAVFPAAGLNQSVQNLSSKTFKNGFNLRRFMTAIASLWSLGKQGTLPGKMLDTFFPTPTGPAPSPRRNRTPQPTSDAVPPSTSTSPGEVVHYAVSSSSSSSSVPREQDDSLGGILGRLAKARIIAEIGGGLANAVAAGTMTPTEALQRIVKMTLNLPPGSLAAFESIFLNYREPTTVLAYMNAIRHHRQAMLALRKMVLSVIEGSYPQTKYLGDSLLKRMKSEQVSRWRENASAKVSKDQPSSKSTRDLTLVFTDDHQDIMRMGSDVVGSCQRVDGDGNLNRGLIGTLMDGKHKLVAIKGENGQIVARAVIRLMSTTNPDPDTSHGNGENEYRKPSPCLLMEKIYPANCPNEIKTHLVDFALKQARRIGVPIAATSDVELPTDKFHVNDCTDTLYSGELAFPVYCDALSGMCDTAFRIPPENDKPLSWFH